MASPGKASKPFPVLKVGIISAVLFANQYSGMVIFPFLAFMTQDFFPELDKNQLGTYAGILGSAFHCGSLCGSIAWGRFADRYGRRPILLLGILGTLLALTGFGFSTNFAMAVFFRFSWGALNGNIGVAKAYISEVCDETQQARGFSVIGLGAGIGRLLGPATGAFLSRPVQQFPETFGDSTFFKTYPYLLPCLVGGLVCIGCFVLAFLFLEETMPRQAEEHVVAESPTPSKPNGSRLSGAGSDAKKTLRKRTRASSASSPATKALSPTRASRNAAPSSFSPTNMDEAEAQQARGHRGHGSAAGRGGSTHDGEFEEGAGVIEDLQDDMSGDEQSLDGSDVEARPLLNKQQQQQQQQHDPTTFNKARPPSPSSLPPSAARSVLQLAVDRAVGISTALYGLLAFITVIAQEVMPLYVLTAVEDGGLNLNLQDIGLMVLYAAPAQILTQVFLFPIISKRLGYVRVYKIGLALCTLVIVLLPELPRVSPPRTSDSAPHHTGPPPTQAGGIASWLHSPVFFPALVFAAMQATAVLSFTSTFVLINNSCPSHERGTANGLGQTYAALGRATGPAVGGAVFAWSEAAGREWPFDYRFVWYMDAIVCAATFYLATRLPETVAMQASRARSTTSSSSGGGSKGSSSGTTRKKRSGSSIIGTSASSRENGKNGGMDGSYSTVTQGRRRNVSVDGGRTGQC